MEAPTVVLVASTFLPLPLIVGIIDWLKFAMKRAKRDTL